MRSTNRFLPAARLLAIVLASVGLSASAAVHTGDRFPALPSGLAPAGNVVLVDFWASWCAPCRASFPAYASIDSDFKARGLTVIGVSVDDKESAYEAFLQAMHPPFQTLRDKDHALVGTVQVPVMPSCYLIGRDGRVRFMHAGFHGESSDKQIREELESLLSEKPSQP